MHQRRNRGRGFLKEYRSSNHHKAVARRTFVIGCRPDWLDDQRTPAAFELESTSKCAFKECPNLICPAWHQSCRDLHQIFNFALSSHSTNAYLSQRSMCPSPRVMTWIGRNDRASLEETPCGTWFLPAISMGPWLMTESWMLRL